MPKVEVVDGNQLQDKSGTQTSGQALGAYSQSNDTVYISRELLHSDPSKAEKILTEEVGHAIDTRVNVSDAKGDEGDIFSRQIHGESMSAETLKALKQENDSGVIEINGNKVEVEYGLRSKIKKKLKKLKKKIKGKLKKVKNKIKKGIKKIGRGIKKGIKKFGKALKKIVQSKLFQGILTIAQFIPIPVVQMVARGINLATSAYNVYQGVKHKSWGAVLGGVAGVAGGVSNFGKTLGMSSGFVNKAASIAKHAGTASMAYNAVANKDFSAAANLAANFFGGNKAVANTIQQAGKAHQVYQSAKGGDYLNAIGVGSTLMQDFTGPQGDKILQSIGQNTGVLQSVAQAVSKGDYSGAVSLLSEQYGGNLNLNHEDKAKLGKVTQTFQQLHQASQMIKSHQYSDAAQTLLKTAEQHTDSTEVRDRLTTASQKVQQFNQVINDVKDGNYAESIAKTGEILNTPIDEHSYTFLTELQSYAENAQELNQLIKNGASEDIIQAIKDKMKEQVAIANLMKQAA
jgi:arsenate reductase-like glutaredoxin family protein